MSETKNNNSSSNDEEEIPMYNDVSVHFSGFYYGKYEKRKSKDGKASKGASIYINESASSRRSPEIQLPRMRAPFGARPPQDNDGNPQPERPTWNVEVAVEDPDMVTYFDELDEQHKQHVVSINSSDNPPFPGYDEAAIGAFWRKTCQRSRDTTKDYAPLMRLKMHRENTEIYVVKGDKAIPGSVTDITPNCDIVPAVNVAGLWFANKSFGATYPSTIVYVFPANQRKRRRVNAAAFGQSKVPRVMDASQVTDDDAEEDDL